MNAPIKEDIWIEQPEGHEIPGMEGYVYKLDQALYGCKQSSHCFQQFLKRMLAEVGATPLVYDDSIYQVRNSKGGWVLIGTHVDDLFALANEEGKIIRQQIFDKMSEEVTITNDGEISWALKASIDRDPESGILKITQSAYIREILARFPVDTLPGKDTPTFSDGDMSVVKASEEPMDPVEVTRMHAKYPFFEAIGCLWWAATISRADIAPATHAVSCSVSRPTEKLWI